MDKPSVIVAAEIYSQNLGDGIIFEALRYLIRQINPDVDIIPYDISRHKDWTQQAARKSPTKSLWSGLANKSASLCKAMMLWHYINLRRSTLGQEGMSLFGHADAVIAGGGQLLRDKNWSFPLKLHAVTVAARKCTLPMHVYACGVDSNWSWLGRKLFRELLSQSTSVSVRDKLSRDQLKTLIPTADVRLTVDPALWIGDVYPADDSSKTEHIGLGLIHPHQISYAPQDPISSEQWSAFWVQAIGMILDSGHSCELFTNGNIADHEFAEHIHRQAQRKGLACSLASRPARPAELTAVIRRYRAVLALRLHANIIATAYHIPAVGLSWDQKVRSFYETLGYDDRCLALQPLDPGAAVDALHSALGEGLDCQKVARLKDESRRTMHDILSQVFPETC